MALHFNGNGWLDFGTHPNYNLINMGTIQVLFLKNEEESVPTNISESLVHKGVVESTSSGINKAYLVGAFRNDGNRFLNALYHDTSLIKQNSHSVGIIANTPQFYSVAFDNSTMDTHINGHLVSSVPTGNITLNDKGNLYVGVGFLDSGDGQNFRGTIQEVRIWNKKLTEAEISHYESKRLAGNEEGLLALMRFDEMVGNTTVDKVTGNISSFTGSGITWVNDIITFKHQKILLKSNNLIYSLDTSNNLIDVTSQIADINNITQLEYETLGFDDMSLIDMTQLGSLQSPKSVIYYTDDTTITNPKLKHEYSFNIGTRLLKRG